MDSQDPGRLVEQFGSERYIAHRVASYRAARGWSQEQLVRRLREHGCIMPQSAISKLESPPDGGRRAVTVDEAIGLAKVFGVPLHELLLPPDFIDRQHLHVALSNAGPRLLMWLHAQGDWNHFLDSQVEAMRADPEWEQHVRALLADAKPTAPLKGEPSFGREAQIDALELIIATFDGNAP